MYPVFDEDGTRAPRCCSGADAGVVVSALVLALAREPHEVFGAATLGHLHVPSSQDTLPMANEAGIPQAEKKQKTAHRILLSLDNRGPHKGSALIHATLATGNAPRDEDPAT